MNPDRIKVLVVTKHNDQVESQKVIWWNNEDRKWLIPHMHYAFREGRTIHIEAIQSA